MGRGKSVTSVEMPIRASHIRPVRLGDKVLHRAGELAAIQNPSAFVSTATCPRQDDPNTLGALLSRNQTGKVLWSDGYEAIPKLSAIEGPDAAPRRREPRKPLFILSALRTRIDFKASYAEQDLGTLDGVFRRSIISGSTPVLPSSLRISSSCSAEYEKTPHRRSTETGKQVWNVARGRFRLWAAALRGRMPAARTHLRSRRPARSTLDGRELWRLRPTEITLRHPSRTT